MKRMMIGTARIETSHTHNLKDHHVVGPGLKFAGGLVIGGGLVEPAALRGILYLFPEDLEHIQFVIYRKYCLSIKKRFFPPILLFVKFPSRIPAEMLRSPERR